MEQPWYSDLRFLDVIFTWHKGVIDNPMDVISELIASINDGPSHSRLFIGPDTFWEFTDWAARFGTMDEINLNDRVVEVGYHSLIEHPVSLTLHKRAMSEMMKLKDTPYDLVELFDQLFDELGLDNQDNSLRSWFVCSSGIEHIFRQIGYPFREDEPLVSPQNIRESKFYRKRMEVIR